MDIAADSELLLQAASTAFRDVPLAPDTTPSDPELPPKKRGRGCPANAILESTTLPSSKPSKNSYSCTSGCVPSPTTTFTRKKAWLEHEEAFHGVVWRCKCGHENAHWNGYYMHCRQRGCRLDESRVRQALAVVDLEASAGPEGNGLVPASTALIRSNEALRTHVNSSSSRTLFTGFGNAPQQQTQTTYASPYLDQLLAQAQDHGLPYSQPSAQRPHAQPVSQIPTPNSLFPILVSSHSVTSSEARDIPGQKRRREFEMEALKLKIKRTNLEAEEAELELARLDWGY